ncbi:MAG: hypothetical protein ACRD2C_17215 [Acidimicrobiales bacterium]
MSLPSEVGAASEEAVTSSGDSGLHCVSEAIEVGSTRAPAPPVCFDTFAESISYATNGTVQLPADATRVTEEDLAAAATDRRAPQVLIGVSEDEALEPLTSARTWAHVAATGCDSDPAAEWQIANVGSSWNDDIDIGIGYAGCNGQYYEHANFAAGRSVMTNWAFGPMEDQTTSIAWR